MTVISTGRAIENRYRLRVSLHFFRWGVHFKLRWPTGTWRHFVIKFIRGSCFGQARKRRMIYVGWWQSKKGVRGHLNGFRFVAALDKLPPHPSHGITVPFFPQKPRDRTRRNP